MLAYVDPILALSWPYVGPMLAYVGPMLAHLGAYVGAMLAISEGIYVKKFPKCHFSRPGPLRGRQNHVKTTVFYYRLEKNGIGQGNETAAATATPCQKELGAPSHSF